MISGIKRSRFFRNSALLMVFILFTLICVLIIGLLFRFAVPRERGDIMQLRQHVASSFFRWKPAFDLKRLHKFYFGGQ
jgi:hypothetical protein